MSTADGAILAMGTVWSHNITRQLDTWYPNLVTSDNLIRAAQLSTVPFSVAAALIAVHSQKTGYLLIVALYVSFVVLCFVDDVCFLFYLQQYIIFGLERNHSDIMLAAVVAPLFGCFYSPGTPSPRAAFCSVVSGIVTRITLEFTLPKDGFLVMAFNLPEFQNPGSAASSLFPTFFDKPAEELWDPAVDVCNSTQLEDYTGVDSLSAFIVSVVVFVAVTAIEHARGGKPLFDFPGLQPYEKPFVTKRVEDEEAAKKIDETARTTAEGGKALVNNFTQEGMSEMFA
jgi:Na+/proline symporter